MGERLRNGTRREEEINRLSRVLRIMTRAGQAQEAIEHGGLYRSCYGGRFLHPLRNPWAEVDDLKRLIREQRSLGGNK